jgi:hypothetical protein
MPQGRFNEYSPQEQAALARDLLQKSGRPLTANNLNAAMIALMRNEGLPSNNMDAAMERTMQPRRPSTPRAQPAQPARNVQMLNQDVDAEAALAEGDANADGNRSMRDVREAGAVAAPVAEPAIEPNLDAEFPGGGGSHSNVGGNTTVMQAIERMLLPLGIAAMLPSMGGAAPVVGAARSVAGSMQRGAEYAGRAPFQANPGRVMDVAPNAIAGQSQRMITGPRGQLPAPTAPNAQAATPSARVASDRQGQASLPRPDADLRRRMIDRNTERSNRNAARTRDERAAGNADKGRRERIERVPEGEVAPARRSSTIRLPPSRRRVSETSGNRRDAMRDD